jgi:type II secretion system protein G
MRHRRGFTLIEMMVVIAIIAVLAFLMVPNYMRARSRTQLTSCQAGMKTLGTALEMYAADNSGHYPDSVADINASRHLVTIPTCPSIGADTYSGGYAATRNPDRYTVVCAGANHTGMEVPENFPQYNNTQGLVMPP